MKERALTKLKEHGMTVLQYRAPDFLLQFLKSL